MSITHHAVLELGDPVNLKDEQTDAGQSEKQEDAHCLMMMMMMIMTMRIMRIMRMTMMI